MNRNFTQSDGRSDSPAPDQFDAAMAQSEQEFTLADEKPQVNRSMVVLAIIAGVGALLVYFMYARGGFTAAPSTDANMQAVEERLNTIMGDDGKTKMQDMARKLEATKVMVDSFQIDSARNQVPAEKLKVNPFALEEPKEVEQTTKLPRQPQNTTVSDPASDVRDAVAKIKVQSILFSTNASTCVLNNKIYSEGQKIVVDGVSFTIRSIEKDHLVLQHPLGRFEVGLADKSTLR